MDKCHEILQNTPEGRFSTFIINILIMNYVQWIYAFSFLFLCTRVNVYGQWRRYIVRNV